MERKAKRIGVWHVTDRNISPLISSVEWPCRCTKATTTTTADESSKNAGRCKDENGSRGLIHSCHSAKHRWGKRRRHFIASRKCATNGAGNETEMSRLWRSRFSFPPSAGVGTGGGGGMGQPQSCRLIIISLSPPPLSFSRSPHPPTSSTRSKTNTNKRPALLMTIYQWEGGKKKRRKCRFPTDNLINGPGVCSNVGLVFRSFHLRLLEASGRNPVCLAARIGGSSTLNLHPGMHTWAGAEFNWPKCSYSSRLYAPGDISIDHLAIYDRGLIKISSFN